MEPWPKLRKPLELSAYGTTPAFNPSKRETILNDIDKFADSVSRVLTKRTDELQPGDRVLIGSRLVRTVDRVVPNGYVNYRNEPLSNVMYREPASDVWGPGNSDAPGSIWNLVKDDPR